MTNEEIYREALERIVSIKQFECDCLASAEALALFKLCSRMIRTARIALDAPKLRELENPQTMDGEYVTQPDSPQSAQIEQTQGSPEKERAEDVLQGGDGLGG